MSKHREEAIIVGSGYLPWNLLARFKRKLPPFEIIQAKPASWVASSLSTKLDDSPEVFSRIDERAQATAAVGQQPLWAGYEQPGETRSPDAVRTSRKTGVFFASLVKQRRPNLIIEFGTAFGHSGMYWLAGLEETGNGHLLTFEPNEIWAAIADENLAAIGSRYTLSIGTFEDNFHVVESYPDKIDLAFIDAIHTPDFVLPQLELVCRRTSPGALLLLDDIEYSDDMRSMWSDLSQDQKYMASAQFGRVGILELR